MLGRSSREDHIHVKVHVGGTVVHTGQLHFNDAVTDAVYAQEPYAAHGRRDTTNAADGIFANGGAHATLELRKRHPGLPGEDRPRRQHLTAALGPATDSPRAAVQGGKTNRATPARDTSERRAER